MATTSAARLTTHNDVKLRSFAPLARIHRTQFIREESVGVLHLWSTTLDDNTAEASS